MEGLTSMPSRIVKLPDAVANQIAAGEVVERPVAVIKELVENSLDAGARSVEIQFEQGGKALMRVLDDGSGMNPEEALLSLQRHATSKIRSVEDILSIGSFGFRGEALPSIASVSRFCLRTRTREATEGVEVRVDGGREPLRSACGMAPGTEVTVSHLFHNVPARRKFMKTDRTEAAHILQMCRLLAVANPGVAFSLIEDGHEVFRTPACPDHLQRVRELFGRKRAEELLPFDMEQDGLRIHGLVGNPGVGRNTRAELITYVNGRPVESRLLSYALIESYHRYLPRGRYPAAFLFVDLPAGEVDVNVHPTKREVRFRNEGRVRSGVMTSLMQLLEKAARPSLPQARPVDPLLPAAPPSRLPAEPNPVPNPVPSPAPTALPPPTPFVAARPSVAPRPAPPPLREPPASSHAMAPPAATRPAPGLWRFCGSVRRTIGLFESPDGLILLNARAARERILFERIHGSLEAAENAIQPMLIPPLLELPPLEASLLADQTEFFSGLGFEIEPFGRHLFRLRSIPSWMAPDHAVSFLEDLVGRVRERGLRPDAPQPARLLVARMAASREARGFIPADTAGWEQLGAALLSCENPLLDARGRPAFVELRHTEIARKLMLDSPAESDPLEGLR